MGFSVQVVIGFVGALCLLHYMKPQHPHFVDKYVPFLAINFEACVGHNHTCGNTHQSYVPPDRVYSSGHVWFVQAYSMCRGDIPFHVSLTQLDGTMVWNASSVLNTDGYHEIRYLGGKAHGEYRHIEVYLDKLLDKEKMYECQTSEEDNPFILLHATLRAS